MSVVLSLGSNLGDREALLREAVRAIAAIEGVTVTRASAIVETPALKPHGIDVDAPAYLNAALLVETTLEPLALLSALGEVEQGAGRTREERWGDRTLDIDIVAWGDLVLDTEQLTIPHPRAGSRDFVLAPWLEIDAEARLGGIHLSELLDTRPARFDAEPLL